MKPFAPMLAAKAPDDLSKIRYPVLVSPKLDGIRCVITEAGAMSRNLKPIPNRYVRACLEGLPAGLDGELIVGEPYGRDVMNRTASGVMSEDGEPDFLYHIFDYHTPDNSLDGFQVRLHQVSQFFHHIELNDYCEFVGHAVAHGFDRLLGFEESYLEAGYEGVMIRDPNGLYKFGRSTVREGGLLKLKRFEDAEATVIDVIEKFHNENEQTRDELGRAKRSHAKAGKVQAGTMGALVCLSAEGAVFEIGTGFDEATRLRIWQSRGAVIERRVQAKYKFQGLTPDGVPRFPVFLGFRSEIDT